MSQGSYASVHVGILNYADPISEIKNVDISAVPISSTYLMVIFLKCSLETVDIYVWHILNMVN